MTNTQRNARARELEAEYLEIINPSRTNDVDLFAKHLSMLDEYWSRWLGFCAAMPEKKDSLLASTPLLVIEIASACADKDLHHGSKTFTPELLTHWREYMQTLAGLHTKSGALLDLGGECREKLSHVEMEFKKIRESGRY